jgi:hypothetical protein
MYTKRVDVLQVAEEAGGERIGEGRDGTGKNSAE